MHPRKMHKMKTSRQETSVVTSKGQLVIPATLRRRLGIRQGTTVVFIEENGRLILQPVTSEFVRGLRGAVKGLSAKRD